MLIVRLSCLLTVAGVGVEAPAGVGGGASQWRMRAGAACSQYARALPLSLATVCPQLASLGREPESPLLM